MVLLMAEKISPEVIAAECLRIQAGWSPEVRLRRLRQDLRPVFRRADGVLEELDADAYRTHLQNAGDRDPLEIAEGD